MNRKSTKLYSPLRMSFLFLLFDLSFPFSVSACLFLTFTFLLIYFFPFSFFPLGVGNEAQK